MCPLASRQARVVSICAKFCKRKDGSSLPIAEDGPGFRGDETGGGNIPDPALLLQVGQQAARSHVTELSDAAAHNPDTSPSVQELWEEGEAVRASEPLHSEDGSIVKRGIRNPQNLFLTPGAAAKQGRIGSSLRGAVHRGNQWLPPL